MDKLSSLFLHKFVYKLLFLYLTVFERSRHPIIYICVYVCVFLFVCVCVSLFVCVFVFVCVCVFVNILYVKQWVMLRLERWSRLDTVLRPFYKLLVLVLNPEVSVLVLQGLVFNMVLHTWSGQVLVYAFKSRSLIVILRFWS